VKPICPSCPEGTSSHLFPKVSYVSYVQISIKYLFITVKIFFSVGYYETRCDFNMAKIPSTF
jgi:hypothetical protein